ncbi:MAG: hypothetical protein R3F30_03170 [Planctomycetota bacterium]
MHTYVSGTTTYHTWLILVTAPVGRPGQQLQGQRSAPASSATASTLGLTLSYTTGGLTDAGGTWY